MTTTAYYMERPASMPMAAPVGAVVFGLAYGQVCSQSPKHRADFATAIDGAVERGMAAKDWHTGLTTTNRSARRLGSSST